MIHQPPTDMLAPEGPGFVFAILCLVTFAVFAVWSIYRSARTRDVIPIVLMAGGIATISIEPMLEYLGLLWMPNNLPYIVWRPFDRNMATWMILGYAFYYGGLSFLAYNVLVKGKSKKYLWYVYIFGWVLDAFFESTGHILGLYKYYGPQPLNPWGVPLWWEFINAGTPVIFGLLCYLLREILKGWKSLLLILLGPCIDSGLYGFTSWPVFTALNSDVGLVAINIAALCTDAIAVACVAFSISLVEQKRASLFRQLLQ
jgi:hypothetical protein